MSESNTTFLLKGKGQIEIGEISVGNPGPGEVKVAIHRVGICGTDIHLWTQGSFGDFKVNYPYILGHEPAGVVYEVGEGVTSLKVGDRVAIEPCIPCGRCDVCRAGRYNICTHARSLGIPPTNGTLRRYIVHPEDFCFKLPDNVSLEEGALMEPLSIAIHTCRRANVKLGDRVLICAAGTIGLMTLLTAKAMGAIQVCMTDTVPSRLETAKKLGADSTVLISSRDPKAVAGEIVRAMGRSPDITIECCGVESSIQAGIYATKNGGVFTQVGLGPDKVAIPMVEAAVKELDIRGVFKYQNCYELAISMVATGRVNVKPLATHTFSLEEAEKAFEMVRTSAEGAIKVMIDCSTK